MQVRTEENVAKSRRQKLENYINTQISGGFLKAGQRLSTVKLAKEWKVSEGTVNQSLHILAAKGVLVRKPGLGTFVGDDTGRQSESVKSCISLIMPDLQQPEYTSVLQCMQQATNNSSYTLNAYGTENNAGNYERLIREHISAGVDAIVMIPPWAGGLSTELLIDLYNSKIPVVTCFRGYGDFGWPLVRTDMKYSTRITTKHLCEIGRRNIGLVMLLSPCSYLELVKEHAFLDTLGEFGLSTNSGMRLALHWPDTDATEKPQMWFFKATSAIEDWLGRHPEIDAVFCLHDQAAWPLLSALAKIGKRVPEDIAVVGSGNMLEFFSFAHNDLTSVDSCYPEIGKAILGLIDDMCGGKGVERNTIVEIKGKLIVRHSTVGNAVIQQ
jgi:LacI family transcriptional regulator